MDVHEWLFRGQLGAAPVETPHHGVKHVAGKAAGRKHFTTGLDLGSDPLRFDQFHELLGPQGGQRPSGETALWSERLDDPLGVGGLGQIAVAAPGN